MDINGLNGDTTVNIEEGNEPKTDTHEKKNDYFDRLLTKRKKYLKFNFHSIYSQEI